MKIYKLYLKNNKEPVELSYEQGLKLKEAIEDSMVSGDEFISIGESSFKKSEVKSLRPETYVGKNEKKDIYYLYKESTNSVVQLPDGQTIFDSFEEAKRSLNKYKFKFSTIIRSGSTFQSK